jgi:UDP-N-acetyl-D-mannosaminuronic acid transferase (WecB/TagA/CpsF family)
MIGVDKLVHKRARTLDAARAHGRDFVNNIVDASSVKNSVVFFVGRGTGVAHEKPYVFLGSRRISCGNG